MKLGLQLGYWPAQPPQAVGPLVAAAEAHGFDAVFTAETWGSDAFTPLAWWGRETTRIRLGTAVAQISARTPTSTAMHALTLDHLSKGRVILGLGVSGPQVVEGWYGQPFTRPLARTREAVSIVRQVLDRTAAVTNDGTHYPLPYRSDGATGLGKPLRAITHPLRADLPIWLGAEGPRNVALAAEIADGWLPVFYAPAFAEVYSAHLQEGFAAAADPSKSATFEIAATTSLVVTEDRRASLDRLKPKIALYMGGMGAKRENFHANLFDRMGYGALTAAVQEAFLGARRDRAAALIPDELVDALYIVGDPAAVRDKVAEWNAAGVTMLIIDATTPAEIELISSVVLG